MADPNAENPADVKERGQEAPVVAEVRKVFEEKAKEVSVRDEYVQAFQKIKEQIPPEQQGAYGVQFAEMWNSQVAGRTAEWGAKLGDFVRNNLDPTVRKNPELRDKYQKLEVAKAKAWRDLTAEKMKQQTAEWEAFKDMVPFGGGKVLEIKDRLWGPGIPNTNVDRPKILKLRIPFAKV